MMKVTKKQRRALMLSRNKWKRIVEKGGSDKSIQNCECCKLFYKGGDYTCQGCPVIQKTYRFGCNGTPYEDWVEYQSLVEAEMPFVVFDKKSLRLAKAELKFLQDLLDECEIVDEKEEG